MKFVAIALICLWWGIVTPPYWLFEHVIDRLAECAPNNTFGTFVWHEHRFLLWKWLASACDKPGDGAQYTAFGWLWN